MRRLDRRASCQATESPMTPAPTITTSYVFIARRPSADSPTPVHLFERLRLEQQCRAQGHRRNDPEDDQHATVRLALQGTHVPELVHSTQPFDCAEYQHDLHHPGHPRPAQ